MGDFKVHGHGANRLLSDLSKAVGEGNIDIEAVRQGAPTDHEAQLLDEAAGDAETPDDEDDEDGIASFLGTDEDEETDDEDDAAAASLLETDEDEETDEEDVNDDDENGSEEETEETEADNKASLLETDEAGERLDDDAAASDDKATPEAEEESASFIDDGSETDEETDDETDEETGEDEGSFLEEDEAQGAADPEDVDEYDLHAGDWGDEEETEQQETDEETPQRTLIDPYGASSLQQGPEPEAEAADTDEETDGARVSFIQVSLHPHRATADRQTPLGLTQAPLRPTEFTDQTAAENEMLREAGEEKAIPKNSYSREAFV